MSMGSDAFFVAGRRVVRRRSTFWAGVVIVGLVLPVLAASPVTVRTIRRANHGLPLGPHRVLIAAPLHIADRFTHKPLTFRAYYPSEPGRFPVIIFSHGLGGSRRAFSDLNTLLASYGYVVLAPDHPDAGIFYDLVSHGELKGKLGLNESVIKQGLAATKKRLGGRSPVLARLVQIKELLSALPTIQQHLPQFRGRFNMHKIGMAGHSFGAFTTEMMSGVLVVPGRHFAGLPDSRIKAVEIISGSGDKALVRVNRKAGAAGDLPMLVITGTRDNPPSGEGYRWREQPFSKSPPGKKFLLLMDGATHDSFQFNAAARRLDPNPPSPAAANAIATEVERASLAFWDYIFKRSIKDGQYLKRGPWPTGVRIEHH